MLKQLGFEDVDEAADGAAALEQLKARSYRFVISDWNMEPMTGFKLLRRVRADEMLRDLPFVMMTTQVQPERLVAAKRAGVDNCIVKAFTVAALRSKIEAICDLL